MDALPGAEKKACGSLGQAELSFSTGGKIPALTPPVMVAAFAPPGFVWSSPAASVAKNVVPQARNIPAQRAALGIFIEILACSSDGQDSRDCRLRVLGRNKFGMNCSSTRGHGRDSVQASASAPRFREIGLQRSAVSNPAVWKSIVVYRDRAAAAPDAQAH